MQTQLLISILIPMLFISSAVFILQIQNKFQRQWREKIRKERRITTSLRAAACPRDGKEM
jgi:hypothetical protein